MYFPRRQLLELFDQRPHLFGTRGTRAFVIADPEISVDARALIQNSRSRRQTEGADREQLGLGLGFEVQAVIVEI